MVMSKNWSPPPPTAPWADFLAFLKLTEECKSWLFAAHVWIEDDILIYSTLIHNFQVARIVIVHIIKIHVSIWFVITMSVVFSNDNCMVTSTYCFPSFLVSRLQIWIANRCLAYHVQDMKYDKSMCRMLVYKVKIEKE